MSIKESGRLTKGSSNHTFVETRYNILTQYNCNKFLLLKQIILCCSQFNSYETWCFDVL